MERRDILDDFRGISAAETDEPDNLPMYKRHLFPETYRKEIKSSDILQIPLLSGVVFLR